jgi:hypothetical protein
MLLIGSALGRKLSFAPELAFAQRFLSSIDPTLRVHAIRWLKNYENTIGSDQSLCCFNVD